MEKRQIIEGIENIVEPESAEVVHAIQGEAEKALEVLLGNGTGTLAERARSFKKKFDLVERLGGLGGISFNDKN